MRGGVHKRSGMRVDWEGYSEVVLGQADEGMLVGNGEGKEKSWKLSGSSLEIRTNECDDQIID